MQSKAPKGRGKGMKLRWSHSVIYVRDIDKMLDFYCGVLGFKISDRGPLSLGPGDPGIDVAFITQIGSDHHQLAFAPVRGDGPSTSHDHMAFRVDNLDEVKEMAGRLQADGRATEITGINHGNAWSVYFRDPEDNKLEVFCDSPFYVCQPQGMPWDFADNEEKLKHDTEEAFGDQPGFKPIEDFYAEQRRQLGE